MVASDDYLLLREVQFRVSLTLSLFFNCPSFFAHVSLSVCANFFQRKTADANPDIACNRNNESRDFWQRRPLLFALFQVILQFSLGGTYFAIFAPILKVNPITDILAFIRL